MRNPSSRLAGLRARRARRDILSLAVLALGVLTLALVAFLLVPTAYSPAILLGLFRGDEGAGVRFSLLTLRLPRVLGGLLSGLAFGAAGTTFQTLLRNPLASPDVLGISTGASAAAVFMILVLGVSGPLVSMAAVLAGLLTALLILGLVHARGYSSSRLILTGLGANALGTATISWLLLAANQYELSGALRWLSGSLNGVVMKSLGPLALVVLGGFPLLVLLGRRLRILELGDPAARALGLGVGRTRLLLLGTAVLLLGFATAVSGPLGFVAFLAGPLAQTLARRSQAPVLPAALVGAFLVIASDIIGQTVFPTRIPAGVVTGMVGAPALLALLARHQRKGALS